LRVWRGREEKAWEKRNDQVEEIEENDKGTKKLYWRRGFWVLEGLYEFFKFNLCCYIIFKIKNIVIICINLSFSKKLLF